MRYQTAGESHGRSLTVIVSDVPTGVPVSIADIDRDLARRQRGYGRGGRMVIETDTVLVTSGMRFGMTLGSPLAMTIENRDWENWTAVMAVEGDKPQGVRVTQPRPGHADLGGILKTGSDDIRDILERASARETAARVAAGAIAKSLLAVLGVEVFSFVRSIGSVTADAEVAPDPSVLESSELRCPDAAASEAMKAAIDSARAAGESLGGVFEVHATGVVPGLGSYAQAEHRLDSALAGAIMSIPAVKGVEIGEGFSSAAAPGSEVHDEIAYAPGEGFRRSTNRAGGVEGGMSNGETIVVRGAMKPIPTLMTPLRSVDIDTLSPVDACKERSDVCAVPAAGVVAEAEVALVLASAYQRKFGHDSVAEIQAALEGYRARITR